jgi:hypothetical protein
VERDVARVVDEVERVLDEVVLDEVEAKASESPQANPGPKEKVKAEGRVGVKEHTTVQTWQTRCKIPTTCGMTLLTMCVGSQQKFVVFATRTQLTICNGLRTRV